MNIAFIKPFLENLYPDNHENIKQILRKSLIIKHLIISMKCKNIYIPLILLIIIEIINKQIISI
jgi:hypothetical protein